MKPSDADERLQRWANRCLHHADMRITLTDATGHQRILDATSGSLRTPFLPELLQGGPYIVMSNHLSYYDVPVLYAALGGHLRMVAKQELSRVPIFGRAMQDAGFIFVDRKDRGKSIASLQRSRALFADDLSVYIAPEGTRSKTGDLGTFKKGGFMLALEHRLPILPVALWGTQFAMPIGSFRSRPKTHVGLAIGAPIRTHLDAPGDLSQRDKHRDSLIEETRNRIRDLLQSARSSVGAP
jgi:1-acyl-sn-glycerol-3-phosphate acyltransferase